MKKSFYSVFIILMSLFFISCENPFFQEAAGLYKVTFETNGGTEVEPIIANKIKKSPVTTKEKCDFIGWYETSDFFGNVVSFPYTPKGNAVLYANWNQKYTVNFVTNCDMTLESVVVSILSEPSSIIKTDCTFAGWFTSASLSENAVTVPFTVEKDLTLYAKWLPTYLVSFETDGGSEITSFRARTVESVTNPEKSSFTFVAWYTDSDLTKKVEFPVTLTADITLYAE